MKIGAATAKDPSRGLPLAAAPGSEISRWEMLVVAALIVALSLAGIVLVSFEIRAAIPTARAVTPPGSTSTECYAGDSRLPQMQERQHAPAPLGPMFAC